MVLINEIKAKVILQKAFLTGMIVVGVTFAMNAQHETPWKGTKCAVVITYDDAIDQHLDHAIPVLDSLGLKATFYLTAFSPSIKSRLNDWRELASKGHELGNHTLFHPCTGGPGREWLKPEQDLRNYSPQRIEEEIRMTNVFLNALDGKTKRTFAFTCGDTKIGDVNYYDHLKNDFVAARGVRGEMHTIGKIDLQNVDCFVVNHHSATQMIEWVKQAMTTNSLLVVLFHGVGGGNGLDVSLADHRKFLSYLKQNEKDILIEPMLPVAEYIKSVQAEKR